MANTDFNIPKDGYLSFDALTLKTFIKDRLNDNNVFTDQNYEGSYISTLNEIIGYTFHTLLYYLNRTSTESMFSESEIYENMNRIVKGLDYNPIGKQSATTTFGMSASNVVSSGLYTIPRYTTVTDGSIFYSVNEDIVVSKTTDNLESFDSSVSQKLLYEGSFVEYPAYRASGNPAEVVFLAPGDNVSVDHFNIHAYVHEADTNTWYEWTQVPTLYLENGFSRSYEVRINENKRYELKFGNDINGKQLQANDLVQIYYLETNGTEGEITKGSLSVNGISLFASNTFGDILVDLNSQSGERYTYTDTSVANNISVTNTNNSTYYSEEESVESIKTNAPGTFRSQYRAVTQTDYENYILTNFANLVHDVKVNNNWGYLSDQMKYYYESVGLSDPNNISNVLYNQVNFADACNFNNIYITVVPKTLENSTGSPITIMNPAQKELMLSSLRAVKTLTSEVVITDPVYIATDMGMSSTGSTSVTLDDVAKTELVIVKDPDSRRDNSSLILGVVGVFEDYFNRENVTLGKTLDLNGLTSDMLAIPGVKNIYTRRTDNTSIQVDGLSMISWNPIYLRDILLITKNTAYADFQFIYLNNKSTLQDRIKVESATKIFENIEY